MERKAIEACPLFRGLEGERLEYALAYFDAKRVEYPRGVFIRAVTDVFSFFGLVLSGTVEICHASERGERTIMATVGAGQTFGESLCYLGRESTVYAVAQTDVVLLRLRCDRLRQMPAREADLKLAGRFCAMLAERTLSMNGRIQILSRTTIRDKVTELLEQEGAHRGAWITLSLDREGMAAYLGVDRASLSRELSRMQKEGLLEFRKNRFRLL